LQFVSHPQILLLLFDHLHRVLFEVLFFVPIGVHAMESVFTLLLFGRCVCRS
jgi:hypothetical protein